MHTAITDHHILDSMEKWGGNFAYHLAKVARAADASNYNRLRRAFPDYWERFAELHDAVLVEE